MYGNDRSKPSPIHDGCAFAAPVRPSTDPDEYVIFKSGVGPPKPGGTRNGYDHEKSPPDEPAVHDADADNGDADQSPAGDDAPAANAYTGASTTDTDDESAHSRRCDDVVTADPAASIDPAPPTTTASADTVDPSSRLRAPWTGVCT